MRKKRIFYFLILVMLLLAAGCSKKQILEGMEGTTIEVTDTVRWFNATHAVLTELNDLDYNIFAGVPVNDATKKMQIDSLEEWWGVTDRASAEETLALILEEGHRTMFVMDMEDLEEVGLRQAEDREAFLMENYDMTTEEARFCTEWYGMYEEYGATAIDGWDFCRAINLLSFYYLAGYYSEQEVLDKSLEIAKHIQTSFESWDDLIASYMRGYEYWAEESSEERQSIYEEIKGREDSPYQLDFKMELVKTW